MAKNKKSKAVPVESYPKTIETYKPVGDWELRNMKYNSGQPSCFNGVVNIKRYKVTVELIEEPVEVYQERLEKLWEESDNFHHYNPLEKMAKEIGYSFKGEFGSRRKK